MPLIRCPNCGEEISEGYAICPNCNHLLPNEIITSGGKYEAQSPGHILIVVSAVLFLLTVGLFALGIWEYPDSGWLFTILIAVICAIITIGAISVHISKAKNYKLSITDNQAYQEKMQRENDKWQHIMEMQQEAEEQRLAKLPVCPICGSKQNVKRLTNLNRSASIFAVGLASAKIGKQYECTHCKHYF